VLDIAADTADERWPVAVPTGYTARERWLALAPEERRKILADGGTGQPQGMPELARIAAGWARVAADSSRHRATGYRATVLVATGTGLAVGGLLPPVARVGALVWLTLVALIVTLAVRVEARLRQLYAWVEACNLNYLLSLAAPTVPVPVQRHPVWYRAPPGRYALLVVAVLVPAGSAIGTGASVLTGVLLLTVGGWAAAVVGADLRLRRQPLAILDRRGVHVPGLTVPWSGVGWVFVGIRGTRFAVGVHWVVRDPATAEALAGHAPIPPARRARLRRRLAADPRVTVNCLLCQESPERLVLISAALQRGSQPTASQLAGDGHLGLLA
jgi:hypothetical protein